MNTGVKSCPKSTRVVDPIANILSENTTLLQNSIIDAPSLAALAPRAAARGVFAALGSEKGETETKLLARYARSGLRC